MKSNHEIKIRTEEITPEIAKKYLARNVANRNLRESTISSYARDMKAGNWVLTHQGVAFDNRGNLIDGQHRLAAIVRSGVTVTMLVTRGLPTEVGRAKTMDAVDRGATRTTADQLKLQHGYRNPIRDVAAATAIVHMCVGSKSKGTSRLSVPVILSVLEIYGRHVADVGTIFDNSKEKSLRRSQLVAALAFARAVYPGEIDQCLQSLLSGANLGAQSPVLALRNFLLSDASKHWSSSGLRTTRTDFAFLILNSLRRFVQNESATNVFEGRAGYVFFAQRQKENLQKLAKIFFTEPAPLQAEPDRPLVATKSGGLAARFVASAKDVGGISPAAEALIARADSRKRSIGGKSRIDYMRDRVKSGAIEGAI